MLHIFEIDWLKNKLKQFGYYSITQSFYLTMNDGHTTNLRPISLQRNVEKGHDSFQMII